MTNFFAHILPDGVEQSVADHCRSCAAYASVALQEVGLQKAAYLAGLCHDMGKYTHEYQDYLKKAVFEIGSVRRGSVNHSFAATRFFLRQYHTSGEDRYWENLSAELLAFATGSHHGLFDVIDPDRSSGFQHRLEKAGIHYEEAKTCFLSDCSDQATLDAMFTESVKEVGAFLEPICSLEEEDYLTENYPFYEGLLARLLLSAVIEGDRRDTAEFYARKAFEKPLFGEERRVVWSQALQNVERKLGELRNETPIQLARQRMSEQCRAYAAQPGGIIRLNLPTGGGKTLSSLRYALAHAECHNKARIIFTSPLLSILDQNAAVIREYVQDDALILEHHSNVVHEKAEDDELDPVELLMESWEAPIIITTLVQLLYTLFDGKTSAVRRFHALCNSVIVIDEVQTVPMDLLSLFNTAVNFLAYCCKATVVLCSATQPCLERAQRPLMGPVTDMVPYQPELWEVFRRTKLTDAGAYRMEELPGLIRDRLDEVNSLLVVCNKKGQAAQLFESCQWTDTISFHLSAGMCNQHRKDTLSALGESLALSRAGNAKTLCIATQVIEAGVDISFASVIRLAAGMDSVVQAAGRCNRNGESNEPAEVSLVFCLDEDLRRLKEIQTAKDATGSLCEDFRTDPEKYVNDLSCQKSIDYYYQILYSKHKGSYQDDMVSFRGSSVALYDLLNDNETYADSDCPAVESYLLRQSFKTAGKLFTVFDNETTDVLVPYGEGKNLIVALGELDPRRDMVEIRGLLEKAKPYTISLYQWQRDGLGAEGALIAVCDDSVLCLQPHYYDEKIGLLAKPGKLEFLDY